MEQSPRSANNRLDSQQIYRLLWSPKVHSVHRSLPLDPILGRFNIVLFQIYLRKILFVFLIPQGPQCTCPTQFIILDLKFIIQLSPSVRYFRDFKCLFLLGIRSSDSFNLCSTFKGRGQVLFLYKTIRKIIFVYIYINL
jgi:hypothetical protein